MGSCQCFGFSYLLWTKEAARYRSDPSMCETLLLAVLLRYVAKSANLLHKTSSLVCASFFCVLRLGSVYLFLMVGGPFPFVVCSLTAKLLSGPVPDSLGK